MAKKIIRTEHSDGTWDETTEVKKGCLHYFAIAVAFIFVLVMAFRTWWLGLVILAIAVVGLYGGYIERKRQDDNS